MHIDEYRDSFQEIRNVETRLLSGQIDDGSTPLLTVIIPTFQRKQLLREAIVSVLQQEPVDFTWEFIVIDNTPFDFEGQTPALRIVQDLNRKEVLYYHNQLNVGSGHNWNRGVELARGQWVVFLHDDDVLLSDALKNIGIILKGRFRCRKPLGYIHAERVEFSRILDAGRAHEHNKQYCVELTRTSALLAGLTGTGMPTCGTAILREAYLMAGGVDHRFGPDGDAVLGYQIMSKYTVLSSGCVLGGYRWGANETLKKSTLEKLIAADELFAQYRYKQAFFSRLWGRLFGSVIRWRNIGWKIDVAKKGGLNLEYQDLLSGSSVKKPNAVWLLIYRIVLKCYYGLQIIQAMLNRRIAPQEDERRENYSQASS